MNSFVEWLFNFNTIISPDHLSQSKIVLLLVIIFKLLSLFFI